VLPVAALPPGPDANDKDSSTERNLPRRNLMRASEETSQITGSVALGTGEEVEALMRSSASRICTTRRRRCRSCSRSG